MAELFQTTAPNMNQHLSAIYNEGELDKDATVKRSFIVRTEGNREVFSKFGYYNLDVIILAGTDEGSRRTQGRVDDTENFDELVPRSGISGVKQ